MYVTESLRNYIITPFFYLYVLKRISINAFSLLILSIKHCITQKEKLKNEYLINKTSSQKYPSWCSTFFWGGGDRFGNNRKVVFFKHVQVQLAMVYLH